MTTYYAQAGSTNIDTASLWNTESAGGGSTLTWANLQADDILCANGKTGININVGFTCAKITTETLDGAGGGGFTISTALTVNANIVAGGTACLAASNGSGQNVTWNGNVTGGTGAACYGVNKTYSGAWIGTGNYTGGSATGTSYGLHANGYQSTITIVGNVLNGTSQGIYFLNDCTATTKGTAGATNSTVPSITIASGSTLTFTGNMIFGYVAPISMVSGAVFYYTPGATNYTDYPTTGPARIKQYNDIPDVANVLDTDTVAGVAGTFEGLADNPFRSPAFG
jgi:hypothetical protein